MKKWLVLTIILTSGLAFTGMLSYRGEYDPVPFLPARSAREGMHKKVTIIFTTGDYVKAAFPIVFL